MRQRIPLYAAGAALAVLLAACGAGVTTSETGGSTPAVPSQAADPNVVDPNAPEVNPAGDIPDDQAFVAYNPPSGGFTVSVPEGWARTDAGSSVSFTDKLNTITIDSLPTASAPTVDSATRTEVPQIQRSARGFTLGKVSTVQRKAGDAVLITYTADGPRDEVTGKVPPNAVERYEFYRDGTEVVLTLAGPVGADNVDPWLIVTDSFGWQ